MNEELKKATRDSLATDGKLRALIYEQAIEIANKRGWTSIDGLEALYVLFAEKYHWTPEQVRHLSTDELNCLLKTL